MTYLNYYTTFAANYGEGAYGASTYACAPSDTACITSTGATPSTSGGTLANTGVAVLAFASLACLIIFAALVIRLWRKPRKLAVQEAENEDSQSSDPSSQRN